MEPNDPLIVLSHYQAAALLKAHRNGLADATTSLDLNRTSVEVALDADGAALTSVERLGWADLEAICRDENACFRVQGGQLHAIRTFSEHTGRAYSLYPTNAAPTMLISGIPMHRIKDTDPHRDTLAKIKAAAPVGGRVLDTTTGLGYTAIEAARSAEGVITVELDPAALEICRQNPWSQELFTNPKIQQKVGDSFEVIEEFADESFSVLLHDPPVFSLAGDLYSADFYRQAWRVLKRSGRMFHYIGDPESKSGARVTAGVVRRLQEAGFTRVVPRPQAFGVLAYKGSEKS
jgi:uncharacterized protein